MIGSVDGQKDKGDETLVCHEVGHEPAVIKALMETIKSINLNIIRLSHEY